MPLPWHNQDNILLISIFAASLGVTYYAFSALTTLTNATEPLSPTKQFCVVNQETEDQVSAQDLLTLSKHPSRQISEAAIKILVTRAAWNEDVKRAILEDVARNDESSRRAIRAMILVSRYEPDAFPMPRESVRESVDDGAESTLDELLGSIEQQSGSEGSDSLVDMADVLFDMDEGQEERNIFGEPLVRGGAVRGMARGASRLSEILSEDDGDEILVPRIRAREGSPSEQARRRRRREAIVLSDGNRPLTQEDIIQRRRTDL